MCLLNKICLNFILLKFNERIYDDNPNVNMMPGRLRVRMRDAKSASASAGLKMFVILSTSMQVSLFDYVAKWHRNGATTGTSGVGPGMFVYLLTCMQVCFLVCVACAIAFHRIQVRNQLWLDSTRI